MALVASTQHLSRSPTASLHAALLLFENELSDEQKQHLYQNNQFSKPSDVIVFVAEIDAANQASRRSISSRLFTFLDAAQQFVGVVDTFVSAKPAIAALVWGGIKTTLVVANNNLPYFDKVTAMITQIGRLSPTYAQFGQLYGDDPEVQTMLCAYYAIIIRICTKIVQLHSRSSTLFSRITSSFETDFKPLLDELEQEQKRLHVQLHLMSHKVTYGLAQTTAEEHNANKLYRRMFSRFQSSTLQEQAKARRSANDQCCRQILENISGIKHRQIWSVIQAQRVLGTAEWFRQDHSFDAWLNGTQTSVLWCSGMLGVGKSVLTSSIIAHLEQIGDVKRHISYHFCRTGHEATLTARGVLGSITRQLLTRFIGQLHDDQLQELLEKTKDMTTEDLTDILQASLEANSENSYFIILDGLDECLESDLVAILSQLKRIFRNPKLCVKIFYSSRPDLESILCKFFQHDAKLVFAQDTLQTDIGRYIDVTLEQCIAEGKLKIRDSRLLLRIAQVLENECQGMLLWLSLFIDELCSQNTDAAILETLEHPPKGIRDLYSKKLSRIRSHTLSEDSVNVLQYAGAVRRPLRIEEMREILSVSLGQQEFDPRKLPHSIDRILRVCSGLITIDEGTRTLLYVHSSLYTHLFQAHYGEEVEGFNISEVELRFSSLCMTYLNFRNFTQQVIRIPKTNIQIRPMDAVLTHVWPSETLSSRLTQKLLKLRRSQTSVDLQRLYRLLEQEMKKQTYHYEFFEYASEHWLQHTRTLKPAKEALFWKILHRCIMNTNLDAWKPWLSISGDETSDPDIASDILTWALANRHDAMILHQIMYEESNMKDEVLDQVISYVVDQDCNFADAGVQPFLNPRHLERYLKQALINAASRSDSKYIAMLLAAGAGAGAGMDIKSHVLTLLHEAIVKSDHKMVQVLLKAGADVNASIKSGETPLQSAMYTGDLEITKSILAAGANPDTIDKMGTWAPLQWAATEGNTKMIELFLAAGADINKADVTYGWAPLNYAVNENQLQVIEMLLKAGAHVSLPDRNGRTPLHHAICRNSTKIVEMLLTAKANLNLRDNNGWTPLHHAVVMSKAQIVRLLLAAGAAANTMSNDGRTLAFEAEQTGSTEIIEMLLAARFRASCWV